MSIMVVVADLDNPGRHKCIVRHGFSVTAAWGVAWEPGRDVWCVTHTPTGRRVYDHARTGRAVECAEKLAELHDLRSGSPGGLPNFGDAGPKMAEVVGRFRAEDEATGTLVASTTERTTT